MPVLVIVPDDLVRDQLRAQLGPSASLRARTYAHGLVLAEQNYVTEVIMWSPPGADASAIDAILRLRRLHRDARIIVVTPRVTKAGLAAMAEHLQVDAYLVDEDIDIIVETVTGVPTIVERKQKTPTSRGGSSAASH